MTILIGSSEKNGHDESCPCKEWRREVADAKAQKSRGLKTRHYKSEAALLHEAFEPFVFCLPNRAEPVLITDSISEHDLKRFPLFSALSTSRL
jgi:hypothetical protein